MKYSEFEREVEREGFNVDRKSGFLLSTKITDKSWESVLNWTIKIFDDGSKKNLW